MEGANYRLTSDRVEERKPNMILLQEHGIFLDSRHIPTFSQTAPKPAASDSPSEDISLEILGGEMVQTFFSFCHHGIIFQNLVTACTVYIVYTPSIQYIHCVQSSVNYKFLFYPQATHFVLLYSAQLKFCIATYKLEKAFLM